MKIKPKIYFDHYIIHPFSKKLNATEKVAAAVSSSVFFVLSLGALHRRALKLEKKIQERDQNPLPKTLALPFQEEVALSAAPAVPPQEKIFADQLSSQQHFLYGNLKATEKKLYETLYPLEGAFADLVLNIVKGRVVDFKVNEH